MTLSYFERENKTASTYRTLILLRKCTRHS